MLRQLTARQAIEIEAFVRIENDDQKPKAKQMTQDQIKQSITGAVG